MKRLWYVKFLHTFSVNSSGLERELVKKLPHANSSSVAPSAYNGGCHRNAGLFVSTDIQCHIGVYYERIRTSGDSQDPDEDLGEFCMFFVEVADFHLEVAGFPGELLTPRTLEEARI